MTNRTWNFGQTRFPADVGPRRCRPHLSNSPLGAATAKPLRGLFPIGFTPFTAENKMDVDGLAAQVKFCNRGGVHGFVWPANR
jgi:hypothetical protein